MKAILGFFSIALLISGPLLAQEKKAETKITKVERFETEIEGWTIHLDQAFKNEANATVYKDTVDLLRADLTRIRFLLATRPDALVDLRKVRIVVDVDYKLGPAQYHPSAGWLRDNGHDPEALHQVVHIPKARGYTDPKHLFSQPAVLIHELAHAYHDQFLDFDNPEIIAAYNVAKESGDYERVLHIRGRPAKHYALTNHKEYFAEMTESYLYVNDFYPFVRAELMAHDRTAYGLMTKIWGPKK